MGLNRTSKLGLGAWTASLGRHTSSSLPLVCPTHSHYYRIITESSDVGRDVALNVKDILYYMLSCHTYCSQYERFSDPAPVSFHRLLSQQCSGVFIFSSTHLTLLPLMNDSAMSVRMKWPVVNSFLLLLVL